MSKTLAVLLLALALGGAVLGILFYQKFFVPVIESGAEIAEIAKLRVLNNRIANRERFDPPNDNRITPDQMRRFLSVQLETRIQAGTAFDSVCARLASKPLKVQPDNTYVGPDLPGITRTIKGIESPLLRLKQAQVEALNRGGFSLSEFRWVRESVLRALGVGPGFYLEDVRAGHLGRRSPMEPRVPAENVALVRGAADSLKGWLPVAELGF